MAADERVEVRQGPKEERQLADAVTIGSEQHEPLRWQLPYAGLQDEIGGEPVFVVERVCDPSGRAAGRLGVKPAGADVGIKRMPAAAWQRG